ncbi:DNA topoisomerase IB [Leucobacter massiliensis]|uniref:DNA topoisomerase n=1 Tax=Leucobacter massiliensis TaxID=1686285 RepID=A0A2S9QLA3_9MICO|nr:DNA topoisomerase IB [Leucobacter massiliensis]PRI10367.1 DNA topoisomerase [Leucobacter massiliensis]
MSGASGTAPRRRRRRLPISRELEGEAFVYRLRGRKITRRAEIARIEALAIPPAWTEVEIAKSPTAKVLARGVDAAGRTQAIYHPSFRKRQDRIKFARLERFGRALPRIRARVDRDLRRRLLGPDRVTACVVRLIDLQFFRVGNVQYAKRHRSFGITTLRREHVTVSSGGVTFDFTGKSGKRHRRRVSDERVARLLARVQEELPGPELFRFIDEDGVAHPLRSGHVNGYVRRHMGEEFTAKDFRTWGGTVVAANALLDLEPGQLRTKTARSRAVRGALEAAAERLGNTVAVTKASYVDPRVLAAAERPRVLRRVRESRERMRPRRHFDVAEQATLALLAEMS